MTGKWHTSEKYYKKGLGHITILSGYHNYSELIESAFIDWKRINYSKKKIN